ncbi:beta-2 adrenergic receptor-like [Panonychus citri]|uniref:beta-2 adrenergic receptor-like n=1 Tax=Panonychus citri TaxID=50023 RepID=UPI00230702F2|nr:beta-2 adrenergic receptor-like [Panonychus citri]
MKNSSNIVVHRNSDSLLVTRYINNSQFPLSSSVNLTTEPTESSSLPSSSWLHSFIPDGYVPEEIEPRDMVTRIIGVIIGCLIIVGTLFGNILVIMVVYKYRRMKSVTNILLASLASADITVAILVMPFLLVYDYLRFWPFRSIPCHFWISCDVMCCTSSILHLCAIALDRYCAITNPLRYKTSVNRRNLYCNIIVIWISSITISFVPIFSGWYHAGTINNILTFDHLPDCELKVNRIYAVLSSSISFYVPLIVMLYVYMRILIIAEEQSRQIKQVEYTLKESSSMGSTGYSSNTSGSRDSGDLFDSGKRLRRKTKQLLVETKAIRTLGIIMGVFCACWLPFFIYYLVEAYCDSCQTPYEVKTGIQWLGYLNSSLNPLIYAFCNQDFKNAFRQILFNTPSYLISSDTCHDETSSSTKSHIQGNRFDKNCEVVALKEISDYLVDQVTIGLAGRKVDQH